MREIKFRAFHKPTNRMFEIYGLGKDWCTEDTMDGFDPDTNHFDGDDFKDNIIVMQFTGLKDCNGAEIYEGDVIWDINDETHSYMQVFWHKNRGVWLLDISYEQNKKVSTMLAEDLREFKLKIIGNIHENKNQ